MIEGLMIAIVVIVFVIFLFLAAIFQTLCEIDRGIEHLRDTLEKIETTIRYKR